MIKMRHNMTSFTISTYFNSLLKTVGQKRIHVILVSFLFGLPKSQYCLSYQRCSNPSKCVNTPGSYYCVCNPGWEKVSEFQCSDINECSRGIHGCDRNSYCVNTAGSWKCICNSGWYADPSNARLPTCREVNECVDKPNACPIQSTCLNSAGSYRCNCLSGWRNQGAHTCVDIDECSEGRYSCPSNSHCVNTQGSYRCDCNRCYYKSGSSCYGMLRKLCIILDIVQKQKCNNCFIIHSKYFNFQTTLPPQRKHMLVSRHGFRILKDVFSSR